MADISEEELDYIADKLYVYAEQDLNFKINLIHKTPSNCFTVTFTYEGTVYGSYFQYEQDKEQRTNRT